MSKCYFAELSHKIDLMNNILEQAVAHGADQGGSYNQNEENLIAAVNDWLKFRDLEGVFVIANVSGRGQYYCKLQIIPKSLADALKNESYNPTITNEYENAANWRNHLTKLSSCNGLRRWRPDSGQDQR